jgi:DNA (cytosine-5)-methyltransferase 1
MQGMKDPRAKCLAGFIQLVDRFLPKAVVIENVQGFATGRRNGISRLEKGLCDINRKNKTAYKLRTKVVDASDYGVPQRRSRAILVAFRNGAEFDFPAATTAQDPVTAWEALRGLAKPKSAPRRPRHWGGLLPSIPEGMNYLWHTRKGGGRSLFGYRTRFWSFLLKLSKREPAWTIPANPGPYTGPFHWKSRPLTIKELLRLQSFPASWRVCGSRVDQVRQVGNATPPLLAEHVARKVRTALDGTEYRAKPTLTMPRVEPDVNFSHALDRLFRSTRSKIVPLTSISRWCKFGLKK